MQSLSKERRMFMVFDPFEVMDPDSQSDMWSKIFKEGADGRDHLDAASANYYVGRIKQNKQKAKQYEEQAKEMKDDFKTRVDSWLKSRQDALDYDTQHCMEMLEMYYEANKPANGKSISLPEGNIGMYSVPAKYDFDSKKEEILQYLQDHQLFQFIRNKLEIDKAGIKKAIREENGKLYIGDIELPVAYIPKTTAFNIR